MKKTLKSYTIKRSLQAQRSLSNAWSIINEVHYKVRSASWMCSNVLNNMEAAHASAKP